MDVLFDIQNVQSGLSTPYSNSFVQGTYVIVFPQTFTRLGITHAFSHWEDGSTNPTRTINLASYMTLMATYVAQIGTLMGTVKNTEGEIITGAKVEMANYTAYTDLAGHYQFENVPLGTYILQVSAEGYQPSPPIQVTLDTSGQVKTQDITLSPIPPGQGTLEVHAVADSQEVTASVEVVGIGTFTTPFTQIMDPGTYTLTATYQDQPTETQTATVVAGQNTPITFQFAAPPTPSAPLQHTRIWTAAHNLKTISTRWKWPLINAYDQAVSSIYTSRGAK